MAYVEVVLGPGPALQYFWGSITLGQSESDNHAVVGTGGRSLEVNELRQKEDRLNVAGMFRKGAPPGLRLGVGPGWQRAASQQASLSF